MAQTAGAECDADWRMSGDWDEDLCKKALVLVEELCFNSPRGYTQSKRCQEFTYLLRGGNKHLDAGKRYFMFVCTSKFELGDDVLDVSDVLRLSGNRVCGCV